MRIYKVKCQKTPMADTVIGNMYFDSEQRMINFCKQWTKGSERFCWVEEFQPANYFNDYHAGYQWVYSFQDGKEVASFNNPYWRMAKVKLSSIYGRTDY